MVSNKSVIIIGENSYKPIDSCTYLNVTSDISANFNETLICLNGDFACYNASKFYEQGDVIYGN